MDHHGPGLAQPKSGKLSVAIEDLDHGTHASSRKDLASPAIGDYFVGRKSAQDGEHSHETSVWTAWGDVFSTVVGL
jgi:hypothetical protein